MNLRILYLFIVMVICSNSLFGQVDTTNFKNLVCKEWVLKSYEEHGQKFPPAPEQKNNLMIFYKDHKAKSIENKKIQNGTWQYDSSKKTLTVVDSDTNEKVMMNVLKISSTDLIIEYKDPEGAILKMYLKPK